MFILEEPYVSELLASTAAQMGVPVLDTPMARRALEGRGVHLSSDESFANALKLACGSRVYANSENAIGWISEHLSDTSLPASIDLFKDKVRFRELVADLFPDYRFAGLTLTELRAFDPESVRAPFVVKPAVGFFSMGVHVVENAQAWDQTVAVIEREVATFADVYPEQVIGLDRFIVEEVIEGEEYAVDVYFDATGEPVLVDILGHLFASAEDVSDRVYYTSAELIERLAEPTLELLGEIGRRAGLKDFPMHAELRIADDGSLGVIEINPMRFGGWCATDLAHFAWGINPYLTYLRDERPDWDRILEEHRGEVTALVISDFPGDTDLSRIESVDYDAFASRFSQVLELRRTDYTRYPVFAFTFVRVPADDLSELHGVLGEDLSGYLRMR